MDERHQGTCNPPQLLPILRLPTPDGPTLSSSYPHAHCPSAGDDMSPLFVFIASDGRQRRRDRTRAGTIIAIAPDDIVTTSTTPAPPLCSRPGNSRP